MASEMFSTLSKAEIIFELYLFCRLQMLSIWSFDKDLRMRVSYCDMR